MNLAPSEATCSFAAGRTSVAETCAAEAARRGDRLQAGDAGAHDEYLGGGHGAGGCHHHRHRLLEHGRGIDDGLVAGEVGLAGQHVHRLGARDARHELHGEEGGIAPGQRLERRAVAVGIEHGDDERAGLQGRELVGGGTAHLQQDVGVAQRRRRRSPRSRPLARAALHRRSASARPRPPRPSRGRRGPRASSPSPATPQRAARPPLPP